MTFDDRPRTGAELAAVLRAVADRIATLADTPLTDLYVAVNIQPAPFASDLTKVAVIDAIGQAVAGRPGGPVAFPSGRYHHDMSTTYAGIEVHAYGRVDAPGAVVAR